MDRFWISPDHWDEPLAIVGEEARHCSRVMRKKVGDVLEVFDGNGRWARGPVSSVERERVELSVEERGRSAPLRPRIEIAVGIPKGKTFDLIIQKAVELGVNVIHPILSEQGMVKIPSSDAPKKKEKWERLALEACKQCGQNNLPVISLPLGLSEYLSDSKEQSLKIVGALLPETLPMKEILTKDPKCESITLLVGPEGDFSTAEYQLILEDHFSAVTLGPLVLRVETAVIAMISAVRYQFPD
ncbi:16S rRNA (uracil(1498)-N(3))-methyltransferase [Akkermansiaceae bacterium]|nr:16S rRNA (uracil(1498)-N(3))-methyltransferase [Akkermansiaceae bacterium]MDB4537504.1 16S rRNA (uracil(1498)-N(3))-methyltransferase [Akkermansiaceae bacterium]